MGEPSPLHSWGCLALVLAAVFTMGALARASYPAPDPWHRVGVAAVSEWQQVAPGAGIVSPEPAGQWATSTWPTTRYYTGRDRVSVWAEWAAGNRVWFETEAALLAAYPGREKR